MSHKLNLLNEKEWYSEGLNFKCTECGKCCTGSPGHAWVTEDEIVNIAKYLNLSLNDFSKKYLRKIGERFALLEHSSNFDCVFLKDNKCRIYLVRPKQCRTFPWWQKNLKSIEDWKEAARFCEGINPNAPLIPYSEIKKQLG